jgi:hypothetical protein
MISGNAFARQEKNMECKALNRIVLGVAILALIGCGSQKSTSTESPDSATGNSPAASNQSSQSGQYNQGSRQVAQRAPAPKPIVVDAGTELSVTLDQSVSSKTNNEGDHFAASVAEPVIVDGKEIIPRGARASGTVTVAKSAGRFKGNAELGLALDSVTINGKAYQVDTTAVEESKSGRGKRTAIGAGGGAVAGAIIGAIAGGGKGAAIGAGAGAGAGTAGAALTGDRDITISPETKLRFRLRQPLEIRQ